METHFKLKLLLLRLLYTAALFNEMSESKRARRDSPAFPPGDFQLQDGNSPSEAPIRSVNGGSVIKEIKSSYSCCDPILKFDPSCENILKRANTNFAYIKLGTEQCEFPCKTIEDDQLILDGCFNVTVTTVCDVMGAKETRTTYLGQECPQTQRSMSPQGSMDLLLLLLEGIWMALFL